MTLQLACWYEWLKDFSPRLPGQDLRHRKLTVLITDIQLLTGTSHETVERQQRIAAERDSGSIVWISVVNKKKKSETLGGATTAFGRNSEIMYIYAFHVFHRTRKYQPFKRSYCGRHRGVRGHFSPLRSCCHLVSFSLFISICFTFHMCESFNLCSLSSVCHGWQAVAAVATGIIIVAQTPK